MIGFGFSFSEKSVSFTKKSTMHRVHSFVLLLVGAWLGAACGSGQTGEETSGNDTVPTSRSPAQIRPLVKITNPDFAAFGQQFPLATLPLRTANDSSSAVGSGLFASPAEAKKYFLPNSAWMDLMQVSAYRRLPDYGNFVALIFASVQQESGGLLLLLVTYTPEGRPVAELMLKEDADSGGFSAFAQDAVLAPNMQITVTRTAITYAGEGENYQASASKTTTNHYQLMPDGTIGKLP